MLKALKGIFVRDEIDILGAEESVKTLPLFQQVVTGSIAGMCEHLGLFPIDTIKAFFGAIKSPCDRLICKLQNIL